MSTPRFVQAARRLDDERQGDLRRGDFLRALDESEFTVSDWEAQFIESFLNFSSTRPGDTARWWTPGRRTSCDRMMSHYAEVIQRNDRQGNREKQSALHSSDKHSPDTKEAR